MTYEVGCGRLNIWSVKIDLKRIRERNAGSDYKVRMRIRQPFPTRMQIFMKMEGTSAMWEIRKLDRKKIEEAFAEYTARYDVQDSKVDLKIRHTYRVAALCEKIAKSQKCSDRETDLAWLSGMLHDVGRFEQLRRYGTFIDVKSVDHAGLSADLIFGNAEGKFQTEITAKERKIYYPQSLRTYVEKCLSSKEYMWIEQVVRWHSAYELPAGLSQEEMFFSHVLRDADKIDILRVNVETPTEQIYNVSTEELRNSTVTPEMMEAFEEKRTILRSLKKTPIDHVVGHIALVFGLEFPESVQIVKEQGYLEKLLSFQSENEKTKEQFARLREILKIKEQ